MEEVAAHNTPDDIWIVVNGDVLDITSVGFFFFVCVFVCVCACLAMVKQSTKARAYDRLRLNFQWLNSHPGGRDVLLSSAGDDASEVCSLDALWLWWLDALWPWWTMNRAINDQEPTHVETNPHATPHQSLAQYYEDACHTPAADAVRDGYVVGKLDGYVAKKRAVIPDKAIDGNGIPAGAGDGDEAAWWCTIL